MGSKKHGHPKKKFHHKTRNKHQKHRTKQVKLKYEEPDEFKLAPHSFVIHRGTVGQYILELEKDFRKVMDPFTASSLQVRKKNSLKDFVSIAGLLKVSHLVMFSTSAISPYLRIARFPHGPTLMFRIHNYSLSRDVISFLKKPMVNKKLFANAPLIILNNFTGDGSHIKLMASVFQNMFPTINVTKVKLADIRRCVILNYNEKTGLIDFRHYAIRAVPVGVSRSVKKIIQSKVPDLSKYSDISDFLMQPNLLSESEAEDDPNSHVEVPQSLPSRGNLVSQKSSIRLSELGPRLTLQLQKIEDGLLNGEVMYHQYIKKTAEEKSIIRKRLALKRKLKERRKRVQEENIKRKVEEKEHHKQKSLKGMKRKLEEENNPEEVEEDDDRDYYKKEIGQEPDEGLFTKNSSTKSGMSEFIPLWKKKKMDNKSTKKNEKNKTNYKSRYNSVRKNTKEKLPFKKNIKFKTSKKRKA